MLGDALGAFRPECVEQHSLGVIEAAAAAACPVSLAKFFQHRFGLAGRHFSSRAMALLTAFTSSSFSCFMISPPSLSPRATSRMAAF